MSSERRELVIPAGHARLWRMRGVGPSAVRINGGKVLFAESDVEAWLDAQHAGGTPG